MSPQNSTQPKKDRLLIFFDFEVFKNDYLAVFLCPQEKWKKVIINDRDEFIRFHEEHSNDLFVGYNCKSYDAWIYRAIIFGIDPYLMNKFLISDRNAWNVNKKGNNGSDYDSRLNKIPFYCYDVYLGTTDKSLKAHESALGLNIHETDVAFDLDRKLTQEEIDLTVKYCTDDVIATIRVFLLRYDIFKAYVNLISHYRALSFSDFGRTRAQISASALESRRMYPMPDDEWDFVMPECAKLGSYEEVKEWFLNPENRDYNKSLMVNTKTCPVTVAFGGIHDNLTCLTLVKCKMKNVDASSYYPNLCKTLGILSRSVKDPSIYTNMITDRLKYKKEGNDGMSAALKIPLNSCYGMSKDPHSPMYDKRMANSVCVSGQLLLLDLIDKVESIGNDEGRQGCSIVNANTDGILVKYETDEDGEKLDAVAKEWENRTNIPLEIDEYVTFISRDVNTYLLVDANGHVKAKGAAKFNDALDNNMSIINESIRAYFLDGITPEEYIGKCDDLMKYIYTCKLNGDFKSLCHLENGEIKLLDGKVMRVFASTREGDGYVGRIRETNRKQTTFDDFDMDCIGKIGEYQPFTGAVSSVNKFANTSEHCFIENGDIRGMKCPDYLDKSFYCKLAWDNIKQWIKSDEKEEENPLIDENILKM